jgi:AAA family ATP:ADP antiporter
MSVNNSGGPARRLVRGATKIEPHELAVTLLSFAFLFALMFAYNILKPVRDAMAPDWSDVGVAVLWTINFVFSAIAVSVYGLAVSRISLRYVVPGVYGFFAASFALFYVGARAFEDVAYIEKAFFVWISLFSLFHVSVFWSLMSDIFNRHQAPRLFAFIASGASIGTIAGSAATAGLAKFVGWQNLMLTAASILVMIVPIVGVLRKLQDRSNQSAHVAQTDHNDTVSGDPLAGFSEFVKNPFLLGIAAFIFLYTTAGSFAWFEIKNLLEPFSRDERTQIWATINLTVSLIAIVIAMFATSRIATRFGLARTLALVPFLVAIGLLLVAVNPFLFAVLGIWVVLKSGNYAITRPAREMLYTIVGRETRFKAKPVIDIVVYRGGDALAGWAFAGLTVGLSLGLGAVAVVGAIIAIIWAIVGVYLGQAYDRASDADTTTV